MKKKKVSSNTAVKQRKGRTRRMPRGRPFRPNDPATGYRDPNINRKGRLMPKSQRELNQVLDEIFAEELQDPTSRITMDKLRIALNRMLLSKNVSGPIHLLERRFGKVPDRVQTEVTIKGYAVVSPDDWKGEQKKEKP